jgi:4-hydroxy-3-polyprenylbenzoate decarboxylase
MLSLSGFAGRGFSGLAGRSAGRGAVDRPSPSLYALTMYRTLHEFLAALEAAGEVHRVTGEVSPILEISAAADRHAKRLAPSVSEAARAFDPLHCDRGGKALLFENVAGCDFPLAINVYGSYRRMEMALGCADRRGFELMAARLGALMKPQPPQSLGDLLSRGRKFLPLLRAAPRRVQRGICQEVIKLVERGEVNLLRLPIIKCWPHDGDPPACGYDISPEQAGTARGEGRYITFAGMHTIHVDDIGARRAASHNIGVYRSQLVDETHLVMHWHITHDGAAHWRSWKKRGERMPIAICFGGESVLPYAASAPLPPGLSDLLMAGFLNGRGIPLVRARTVPLWVPANSEIVIEGYVSTECAGIGWDPDGNEALGPGAAFEGPFGDHTGFYSLPDRYPLVEVTAVTHRRNAVFPATIVGIPPQEDYYLGKATERIFLPLLKTLIPDIIDYHMPMFGCFHNCVFISIDKAYPLQARKVMHAIWGAGQMAWTKMIIVVDADVDVHDEEAVLRTMLTQCHFMRDVELINGPLDILDHAAPRLGAGHKIGFDATRTIRGEEVAGIPADTRPKPMDAVEVRLRLRALLGTKGIREVSVPDLGVGRCVFIAVEKTGAGQGIAAIEAVWDAAPNGTDFVVAVNDAVDVGSWEQVFFQLCANADPGRDAARRGDRLGFDATTKQPGDERAGQPVGIYPPVLAMDEETTQRVDRRAAEFGLT